MVILQKEIIDDDRWNRMCRRVRRVELFNILLMVLGVFFSNKVTITWYDSSSSFDSKVYYQAPLDELRGFVKPGPAPNPSIRKRPKVDIEKISFNEEKGREKEVPGKTEALDKNDYIKKINEINPKKEKKENSEMITNNKIGKYVSEKQKIVKTKKKISFRNKNESSSRILTRKYKKKSRNERGNTVFGHPDDTLNEGKSTAKNAIQSKAHRDLQSDDELSNCNGTLFHLEMHLDLYSEETAWELAERTPDDVFIFFNYTSDVSFATHTYKACLDDGNYYFILYDSFADGITCGKDSCFSISLNNEVVFSDITFTSSELMLPFVTSSECRTGVVFEVEYPNAMGPDSNWALNRVIHDKENEQIELNEETIVDNETARRSTCVSHGTYLFEGQDLDCDDCYKVFINSELITQGKNFLGTHTHTFYVSPLGKGYEQHCDKLPPLTPTSCVNDFIFDEIMERKLDAIYSLASMNTITNDLSSPQYQAACWILHDDKVAYEEEVASNRTAIIDDEFMERYIFALFLFATQQDIEKLHVKTCEYDKVRVSCKENRITKMDFLDTIVRGFIPSEIRHLRKLEHLDLGSNNLHGTIPEELSELNLLEVIYLDDNEITGSIPSELGNLVSLESLSLRENKLTGTIPGNLGQCSNLNELFLDENLLQGSITSGIFRSHRLEKLNLGGNHLTGTIPSDIVQFQHLQEIVLQRNLFEGSVPTELWALQSLSMIDFDKNQLTGTIQSEIGNLQKLEWIDVDQNMLTGTLPNAFTNLTKLEYVDLSNNRFEGQIPDTLWQTDTEQLFISQNDVVGSIPDDFCREEKQIRADASNWFADTPKVNCSCCQEGKCYMWDLDGKSENIQCPLDNLYEFEFFKEYEVKDVVVNETIKQGIGPISSQARLCLSPTGCYDFMVQEESDDQSVSKKANFARYPEGADFCSAIDVCGEIIGEDHTKRAGLNHFTQLAAPDLSKLNEQDSATYKALCDVLTRDEMYEKYQICDGSLLQRYVLLYFYYSLNLDFDFLDLATNHTCEWPGVSCASSNNFIKRLDLSSQNLKGSIITEIGLLKTLEEIDLSNNTFVGTIDPATYINLPDLKVVRLGTNEFGGTFPNEMLEFEKLTEFNISGNLFVGSLPEDVSYSRELKLFDISNNLFQGKFPVSLLDSPNLEVVDLSINNFEDNIPTGIGNLKKLNHLRLNQNGFDGSIPFEIFNAAEIKELMLQSNKLTGSIPTEIANLESVEGIFMSHNNLKGSIPMEIRNLNNLTRLQLHRNQLYGIAPSLKTTSRNLNDFDYITDCGDPEWNLPEPLLCEGCTMCCNSEKKCQLADPTILTNESLFLIVFLIPPAFILLYVLSLKRNKNVIIDLFVDDRDPLSIYNDDSVYCFILSNNKIGTIIYALTVIIQVAIFSTYLSNSVFREDADWKYTYKCLSNSIDCIKDKTDSFGGVFLFFIVTILFLGNDFSMSLLQLRKAVFLLDSQLLLSGGILFFLSAYSLSVSFRYNTALAEKNTSWITNALILLFVNELDEKVLNILVAVAPEWTVKVLEEVKQNMSLKKPHQIPSHLSIPVNRAARRNMTHHPTTNLATTNLPTTNFFTTNQNIATSIPNTIAGFVPSGSGQLPLMKKLHKRSKIHEGELDYPLPIQSEIVEDKYVRQRNWHAEEVDCLESDESDSNEVEYPQSRQDVTDSLDYLDSNKDPSYGVNEVDPIRQHITDFDLQGPTKDEIVNTVNSDNDHTHENQTNEINHLDTNENVVLDYVQEYANEEDHLDSAKGDATAPVVLEEVESNENEVRHLDSVERSTPEANILEVVQSHKSVIVPATEGDISEPGFLGVV